MASGSLILGHSLFITGKRIAPNPALIASIQPAELTIFHIYTLAFLPLSVFQQINKDDRKWLG